MTETQPMTRRATDRVAHFLTLSRIVAVGLAVPFMTAGCERQHGGALAVAGSACVTCHQADYDAASNPVHRGQFPTTCGECHGETSWRPATGGAHPEADFSIATGPHAGIQCDDCHDAARGRYGAGANTDCVGCHSGEHARDQVDGSHGGVVGYPPGQAAPNFCLTCHPNGLAEASAHPEAAFPIATGPHQALDCWGCHNADLGSSVGGANADCVGCHTGEHERAAMDLRHRGVQVPLYPTGPASPNFCLNCHPTGLAPIGLHPEVRFPIGRDPHAYPCADCHVATRGANTGGANTDCIGCHEGSHARSLADPQHRGVSGYPAGPAEPNFCLTCHPTGSADGAAHPEAAFPIANGTHAGITCEQCHDASLGASVGGANTNCVDCHTGEHERRAVDPQHVGVSGYPAGSAAANFCLTCHPSGAADSARHPEDRFRISGGAHGGIDCNGCHNPALGSNVGGANSDCIGCHSGEHSQSRMDSKHRGRRDYRFDASNPDFCRDCHADGRH